MAKVIFDVADTFAARRDLAALQHPFVARDGLLHIEFEDVSEEDAMFLMIKASTSHGFRAKELPGSIKAEPLIAPHLAHRSAEAPRMDREDSRVARKDESDHPAATARVKEEEPAKEAPKSTSKKGA